MDDGQDEGGFKSKLEWFVGNGQEHRAYQAIEQGDFDKARRLLEPVAARNSIYSLLTLGGLYEAGNLGSPDFDMALSHYRRAASQGSAEAYRRIGQLSLDQGEEDRARAAFTHGAEAGNISCMYWLGKLMVEGRGGSVEADRGIEWLEAATVHGHLFAKRKLLAIEGQNASSILRKLSIGLRIASLVPGVVKELLKDRDSDLLR